METLKEIKREYLKKNPNALPWNVQVTRKNGQVTISDCSGLGCFPFKSRKNSDLKISL